MAALKQWKTKLTSLMGRTLVKRPMRLAGHQPVASITFDDFPKNAWTQGGAVLARRGIRATYYTAGGFCGRTVKDTVFYDAEDLKAVAAAGHEIGCHGFGHQPAPALSNVELAADARRNAEFLKPFLKGEAPVSYAYPYGRVSVRSKRLYASRFASLRGTHGGINIGRVDLAQLSVISLEMWQWDQDGIEAAVAQVLRSNGWLILATHDVSERPSRFGSTPGMLDWALDRVAAAGIRVLPVREALPVALGL
ncbi:MAG TPA: polysaccharide deacetylase family protein [Rhizomicrobium sp.]|nr:polysaccharide deacetylase family protein [Rhizomicrobium sp.]